MRTKEQVMNYLVLSSANDDILDIDKIVEDAMKLEKKYEKEISDGTVGYSLLCDFDSGIAEDSEKNVSKIEQIDGLVVYNIIKKTDIDKTQDENEIDEYL